MYKMCNRFLATFTLLLLMGLPMLVHAQENPLHKTKGLFSHIHANGNYFNSSSDNGLLGGGAGAKIGWGFKRFSLFTGLTVASLGSNRLSNEYEGENPLFFSFELIGAQYYFKTRNPSFIPYAEALFSVSSIIGSGNNNKTDFADLFNTGAGPSVGAGFKYFLSESISFDTGLSFAYYSFGKNMAAVDVQLLAGFSFYPFN